MCVMAVVGAAPCQCFSPGENQTTSPEWISSMGPPQRWVRPEPDVTIRVWPSGCVCQAVRAPGSNVMQSPTACAGCGALNKGSIRTAPVKYSEGPWTEGCESLQQILEFHLLELISLRRNTSGVNECCNKSSSFRQQILKPLYHPGFGDSDGCC